MEEKSFLDDHSLKVNDVIDEVLFDGDDQTVFYTKGEIKDPIKIIKNENKRIQSEKERIKAQREKEMEEALKRESKRLQEEIRFKKRIKFFSILGFMFIPNNLIKIIQYYEELLFVIFVDTQLIISLLSLMYLSYIIISYDGNLSKGAFKFVGTTVICILCVILQEFTKQGK